MKIDLHLHSKHSKRPSQWILQKIGCPESFAEPSMLDRLIKKKGMSALTFTDHNTIGGCLEIAHLPFTFVSEEITTYFPEDKCKVHVLAYNINETIHQDIQKVRENIYDLVGYLNEKRIVHSLAHCLFAVNDRITLDHFEKFLLLFKTFELNGAREEIQNVVIRSVLEHLTAQDIEELSNRHDMEPRFEEPWRKHLTAGSDDHSALNTACMYTEVPGAKTLADFLKGIEEGRSIPRGRGSSAVTLAHNIYGIAYQFYNGKFNLGKYTDHDVLMRFLDRLLQPEPQSPGWLPVKLKSIFGGAPRRRRQLASSTKPEDVIRIESEKAINSDPILAEIIRNGKFEGEGKEERWFRFVNRVTNTVLHRFGNELFNHLSGGDLFSIFSSIGAAGSLYFIMAPYFVSFSILGHGRPLQQEVLETFGPPPVIPRRSDGIKVAHFTDTFYEINGVGWTLRQQAELAAQMDKDLTVITCAGKGEGYPIAGKVKNFEPIDVFEMPVYPEQKLFLPPFLEMLRYVYEEGYNYIHSATPGPIGLVALAIARIIGIPISGTYHTAIPQYAARLTEDEGIANLTWRYTLWYYDQMEKIYVPSHDTGDELIAKGIAEDKILLYPRGVNVSDFHPGLGNGFYEKRYQLKGQVKLLYTGRVSKEKNMPLLADAFKRLCAAGNDLQLIVVGDGPYLPEMKAELEGYPCTFTGFLTGQDLARSYASADLFVFPSTTDTFGNVILEAQASGLPVVVTDAGGPRENILPGKTGVIVPGNDMESLVEAIRGLVDQPLRLKQMGKAAREYMETRSFEAAFLEHWNLYCREKEKSTEPIDFAVGHPLPAVG